MLALISIVFFASTTAAFAASDAPAAPSEALFVVQILALLVVGGLMGEGMQRIGQPAIMGQLLGGLLLGPSVFGAVWPDMQHQIFPPVATQKAMLDAVSQLGILLLLLLTGMEMDLTLIAKMRRAAVSVSVAGVVVPFLAGVTLGEFLPESLLPRPELRLITALFLGTALAISSVKIVAAVVRNLGFMRRRVGQLIVASAIIDDVVGWIVIAVIFGLALHGSVEPWSIFTSIAGTLLFLVISLTLGQRLVSAIIRQVNDRFVSEFPVITAILIVAGCLALITDAIGVHTVLGAFVAGILIGRSPILTQHIRERLQGLTVALFMPVFFLRRNGQPSKRPAQHRRHRGGGDDGPRHDHRIQGLTECPHRQPDGGDHDLGRSPGVHAEREGQRLAAGQSRERAADKGAAEFAETGDQHEADGHQKQRRVP